jgi:hypothetical protein
MFYSFNPGSIVHPAEYVEAIMAKKKKDTKKKDKGKKGKKKK